MDTLELTVDIEPRNPWSEIAIAELSEQGFDSFVETETGFQAYARADVDADAAILNSVLSTEKSIRVTMRREVIPYQNWNASWEENFQPVEVEGLATILAPFHDESVVRGMKVLIQPHMSFGTGHHQTTWMMTRALFDLDPMPVRVLDMGTGTGVLAVVAEKLGAREILAVDIEDWSVENARENVTMNGCQYITCVCGDIDAVNQGNFGLILANINKNVLKAHLPHYARLIADGGVLLLSGFFTSDVEELEAHAETVGFRLVQVLNRDEWATMKLIKTNE